jgi:large subunit ribosomal protein L3
MSVGLLGRKVGMTQIYDEAGSVVPVTVLEVGPCTVLQVRSLDRDGYQAVQLGFADKPRRVATRPERGHVAKLDSKRSRARAKAGVAELPKADCEPKRFVREFRVTDGGAEEFEIGQELTVDRFGEIGAVDVIATSKGRGFAGVIKRHGFSGLDAAHGVKRKHRHPGSIGRSADPSHVVKGMRMAGHYGNVRCTVRNLQVVRIDSENNLLLVKGAVPGPNGGFLVVGKTKKHDSKRKQATI